MARDLLSKPIYHLLLVIILGVLGYSNTFNVPFELDDWDNIVQNPVIQNLDYYITPSKARVHEGPVEYPMLINRYVGSLTFALNYKIHGLDVTGYHVANLLIHLINSLLVYWLVQLIFITLGSEVGGDNPEFLKHSATIALFSSLLFVSHPLQTQAVTYIVQRFSSLATMVYLFSIIMYIKFRLTLYEGSNNNKQGNAVSSKAPVYYLLALFSAVLAMKTKEIAFTLPAMIVSYELIFFKGDARCRFLYLSPLALTMLIIPVSLTCFAALGEGGGVTRLATDMPRLDYLFTEFRVIITYIRLVFFPVEQNLDYDYPLYDSMFNPQVFLSLMALLTIFLTVIYSFCRYRTTFPLVRVIFFGTAWFFVTLSIESSIIPIKDVIFEHRMYLPSFGIFLVISLLFIMIIEKWRQKWLEVTILLSVIITSLVFTGITYSRNSVWNDRILLWQDVVNKSPRKARGYNALGKAYEEKGNIDRAIKYYKKAIFVDPAYSTPHYNLGIAYIAKELIDEAIESYSNAINIDPSVAQFHNNLGIAYSLRGLNDEAIRAFIKAINIRPSDAKSYYNLGLTYMKKGLIREAEIEMGRAAMLDKLNKRK